MKAVTLKISCKDRPGLIAQITRFVYENNGNFINLDQHTDVDLNMFFMRAEWDLANFKIKDQDLNNHLLGFFKENKINADYKLCFSEYRPKMALFVSKYEHCFWDLLLRQKSGDLKCDIPLVISNHKNLEQIAKSFGKDFYHIPINAENKNEAEKKEIELFKKYKIDFIVLARYMQILTNKILDRYENKIINIHHSFLPAFKGANPYGKAYERGVKIIGATAHFVTQDLDKGPIITQDVISVSHKENVNDLIVKGKDVEKLVLSKAIKLFIENRIFVYKNRTMIL